MRVPFSTEQFFEVFTAYNQAVWPAQIALVLLGALVAVLAYQRPPQSGRFAGLGLALLWAWMGVVYHLWFFRAINPAAVAFGGLFILEALLLALWAVRQAPATAGPVSGPARWIGGALLAYAFLAYPLLGWLLGHRYPASPTFGLPCPTTIATLGVFLWVSPRPPCWVVVIPLLWVVVGSSAAFALGVREDLGLLAAGLAAIAWRWYGHRHVRGVDRVARSV